MATSLETFWQSYLASLPEDTARPAALPPAWYFCDNEADANELAALVKAGIKQATASLGWGYDADNEPFPQMGDLSIVINWDGEPQCIIETTEVQVRPFNAVDAQFAYDEGEGDRSLAYWRKAHWAFFTKECAALGREPTDTMPVVCERFRLVF